MKRLTKKDRLFCFELLADPEMNPENAAIKAGYSKSMAHTKAYQWVSNSKINSKPQVKAFLDQMLKQRERNLELDAKKIDEELMKIAFSNITDIIEKMGGHINLEMLKELTDGQKHAIAEIAEVEFQGVVTRKIKMHSKLKALELLMKRTGKNKGDLTINVKVIKDEKVIKTNVKQITNGDRC